jgi:hypothetical protein
LRHVGRLEGRHRHAGEERYLIVLIIIPRAPDHRSTTLRDFFAIACASRIMQYFDVVFTNDHVPRHAFDHGPVEYDRKWSAVETSFKTLDHVNLKLFKYVHTTYYGRQYRIPKCRKRKLANELSSWIIKLFK